MNLYEEGARDACATVGLTAQSTTQQKRAFADIAAAYGARHMTPDNEQSWGSAIGHGLMGAMIGGVPAMALGGAVHPALALPAAIPGGYLGGRASKKIFGSGADPDAAIFGFGRQNPESGK